MGRFFEKNVPLFKMQSSLRDKAYSSFDMYYLAARVYFKGKLMCFKKTFTPVRFFVHSKPLFCEALAGSLAKS